MRTISGYSLYLGHRGDVTNLRALLSAGVQAVVDLALEELPVALPRELVYCRFPLLDGADNPPWLLRLAVETVAEFLRAGVPVLVCCGAGMSRSPCVAGAVVARTLGSTLQEGLRLVSAGGPTDVAPALWADFQAMFENVT